MPQRGTHAWRGRSRGVKLLQIIPIQYVKQFSDLKATAGKCSSCPEAQEAQFPVFMPGG